jgi:hypothetical protein
MRIPILLLFTLLLGLVPAGVLHGQTPAVQAAPVTLDDGPYVLWEGPKARVLRVRQGVAESAPLAANGKLALEGLPPLLLAPCQPRPSVVPMPKRIAAVSDIHGNYPGLVTLLEKHGILDLKGRWTYGKGHLVVVGDVFDRGPGVTESLWLLRSLEAQARKAGGDVHVLLGNHEAMTLNGDLRYLNPKYATVSGLLATTYPALYGPDTDQGRWLRSLNVMVRIGDILFLHGGPSPAMAAGPVELQALNAQFRQAMVAGGHPALLGSDGPVWYRGLIPGASRTGDATDPEVTAILKAFSVKWLVVGHSTLDQVTAFHGGRVFGIDAGLQHAGRGELWLWEKGKVFRGLLDGTRVPMPFPAPEAGKGEL